MNCILCSNELIKRDEQMLQCPFVILINGKEYNHYILSNNHFSVYNNKFALAYMISIQELWVKDIIYAGEPSKLLYNININIDTAYDICRLSGEEMIQKLKVYQTFS